jgi:hypothetical protein
MANIDMVIDNLEDFQSSVVSHSKLIREKYVIQRFNLGSTTMVDTKRKPDRGCAEHHAQRPFHKIYHNSSAAGYGVKDHASHHKYNE